MQFGTLHQTKGYIFQGRGSKLTCRSHLRDPTSLISPPETHPHPEPCPDIYASAVHAKPNVHVGVGRMGKGDALLIDSTELDGGRGPSSSGAVARSPPLLACMNEPAAIYTSRTGCARLTKAYTEHTAPVTQVSTTLSVSLWLRAFRRKNVEPREQCDAAEDAEDDAHDCVVWL